MTPSERILLYMLAVSMLIGIWSIRTNHADLQDLTRDRMDRIESMLSEHEAKLRGPIGRRPKQRRPMIREFVETRQ